MMINLSFFKKSKLGISISTDSIIIVEIEKNGNEFRLKDFKSADSKGYIKPSLTEQNIIDPASFKKAIKTLIGSKKRSASISIPDASVKTALLELESMPSKKTELRKLIKWKMEKSVPFKIDDAHISCQALNKKNILVSVIRKGILYQYEELLREASVEPVFIDTASSHTFNLFHDTIVKESESFIFLNIIDSVFTLMIFKKGCPDFIRVKALRGGTCLPNRQGGEIKRVRDELLASLKFYSHSKEISDLTSIYYIADINIETKDLIEDSAIQVRRLGIEQIKWLNTFFTNPPVSPFFKGGIKESPPSPLLNLLPAIGAAVES
jgi:hypothetical protein